MMKSAGVGAVTLAVAGYKIYHKARGKSTPSQAEQRDIS